MALHILLILVLGYTLQADFALTIEDWQLISQPSHYLEPPLISRTYRSPYLTSKFQKKQTIPTAQTKWYDRQKQWPPLLDAIPKFSDYTYHKLRCNPCNTVPWIPIITFKPAKIISSVQNQGHVHPSPFSSYYHTFNEMTANLIKPINVLTPTLPFYVGTPVYQQHVQNPAWHSGPAVVDNGLHQVPNLNHIAPAVSVFNQQPLAEKHKNVDTDVLSPQWLNDAKAVPVFHYTHTIEYPAQLSTRPLTDLSVHPTSIPSPETIHLPTAGSNYMDDNVDGLHDISNHLDDTKYSSSEDKFSITSNETVKDVRQLKTNDTESGVAFNSTGLTDFLTPPASAEYNGDWNLSGHTEAERVQMIPLENWAFINEVPNAKPEKQKKQIQIVVPYTVNKIGHKHNAKQLKENVTSWNSMLKVRDGWPLSTSTSTTVLPIIRYLRDNATTKKQEWTDWQKLRKAIDTWTVERFSNHKYTNSSSHPVDVITSPSISWKSSKNGDRVQDSSDRQTTSKEKPDEIQNRASSGTKNAAQSASISISKPWNALSTTVSTVTKEKVFIVTPIPLTNYNFSINDVTDDSWRLVMKQS